MPMINSAALLVSTKCLRKKTRASVSLPVLLISTTKLVLFVNVSPLLPKNATIPASSVQVS